MKNRQLLSLARAYLKGNRARHALGAWLDYRRSLLLGHPILGHYPPALMLEPSNICNLQCPMCPSGNGSLSRPRGHMPLYRYERILKQVQNQVGMLILWNQGESFLNPAFYEMLELAADMGFFTLISTNASLPLDIDRLAKIKIGKLIVSMDGISEESYDKYRINGNYKQVLANLRAMASIPSLSRALVWQFIVMRHNEHEIPKVKQEAASLGISLELKTVQIYHPDEISYLPQNPRYSRYKITNQDFEIKTALLNRCRRLWLQPVINQDGQMAVCCYDKDASIPIGSIDEHDFKELWLGEAMMRMRRQILSNRASIPICRNCGEGIVQRII